MAEDKEGLLLTIQKLWCQHCKALQKTSNTIVECWYNPIIGEEGLAFCSANEDASTEILSKVLMAYKSPEEIKDLREELRMGNILYAELTDKYNDLEAKIEEAKKQERERIIRWVEGTDILTMLSPHCRREWQALKSPDKGDEK